MAIQYNLMLDWEKDEATDGYIVKQQIGETLKEIVRIENINMTKIQIYDVKAVVEYHFQVSYYCKEMDISSIYRREDFYCFATRRGNIIYKFPIPRLLSAKRVKKCIIIKWKKVSDEITYQVFRSTEGEKGIVVGMTSETSFIDREIDAAKVYKYTVRCTSEDGQVFLSGCSLKGITI